MKNLMKNRSLAILTSVLSVVTCFAFLPQTQATPDALPPPSPDGCYPGFTTAEGCNALKLLTSGAGNTGLGWHSLSANTSGNFNTGVGAGTLILNNGDSNTATALAVYVDTDGHLGTHLVNAPGKKLRGHSPQPAQPQATRGEFQKQQKRITELENTVARLAATVKEQAAQIQKVSAQLEVQKPETKVANNQ